MKTLIIAEAGVNHNGDIDLAKQLISAAKLAGADMVKFQTFKASNLVTRTAGKAIYQKNTTDSNESQYDMISKLELSREEHESLIEECRRLDIGFLSTAFDHDSFEMLLQMGINQVKIPSGELTNLPFLRYVARLGMPMILSTGMANLGEVEAALEAIEEAGTPRSKVTVLHCTTEYPSPMMDVNLMAMVNMKAALGVDIGYSDHTQGIEVAIAATALGARVIEKHFTLDRGLPGPDHQASLEPHELKAMIDAIRNIEMAFGDGVKRPTLRELQNRAIVRRSIVASRRILAGEVFSSENISTKRPGNGISPMRWDEIVGRTAPKEFAADELIEL